MRAALLLEYFPPQAPGGAEWSALALAEALAARGVEPSIVTFDLADDASRAETAALDERLRQAGVQVRRLPFARKMHGAPQTFPSYVFGNPLAERRLARRIDEALGELRVILLFRRQDFQRHKPTQSRLARFIDRSHAAPPQQLDDFELREKFGDVPDWRRH